jgi:hypothetical protein
MVKKIQKYIIPMVKKIQKYIIPMVKKIQKYIIPMVVDKKRCKTVKGMNSQTETKQLLKHYKILNSC